jgi:hypothetical protein
LRENDLEAGRKRGRLETSWEQAVGVQVKGLLETWAAVTGMEVSSVGSL